MATATISDTLGEDGKDEVFFMDIGTLKWASTRARTVRAEDSDAVDTAAKIQMIQWNHIDDKYEPIPASDVQRGIFATQRCVSRIEVDQWIYRYSVVDVPARCQDAVAVLTETVGGAAREWWRQIVLYHEKTGLMRNHYHVLQILLILIMSSKGACTNSYWLELRGCYIVGTGMFHNSFTSSAFEGRIMLDWTADRPWQDLAEVVGIVLPYFREMNARVDALSKLRNVGYSSSSSSDSQSIFGPTNIVNLIACLDIAESVAKLVPVFGDVLEGACGILRKTLNAAEVARAARDECKALAEHTACITLAIINEIGSTSKEPAIPTPNIFDLCATIGEVERRITRLSTLGRLKYLTARGKINAEVKDLRARVDNARIAFKIRSDISTTGLLYDLRMMQTRLASRVEDIYMGQQTTHHMLHTILVEVRGQRTEHAYVEEAN